MLWWVSELAGGKEHGNVGMDVTKRVKIGVISGSIRT